MKGNFKIFFCILIGVLLILAGYLLIDLNVISFNKEDKKDSPIDIVDPIGPTEDDPVVVPITGDVNETDDNTTVYPSEDPTTTPTNPSNPTNPTNPQTTPTTPNQQNSTNTVQFEESSYTCYVGDEVATNVNLLVTDQNAAIPTVSKYETSDKKIATIEKHPSLTARCLGCTTVKISCKKAGKATLTVTMSNGQKAKATVQVLAKKMSFEKSSYECVIGETISTKLTLTSDMTDSIASYSSANNNVASLTNSVLQTDCVGCVMLDINCRAEGTVNITAKSRNGLSTTSSVKVVKPTSSISFDKTSFECEEGQTLKTTLSVSNSVYDSIASYASSNTSVATLTPSSTQPNCAGCLVLDITCKQRGNATLSATSKNGSGVAASIKVNADVGTISLGKSSFSCVEGEQFTFLVTAKTNNTSGGNAATIKSVTSSDTSVVSFTDAHLQTNCVGCHNYLATCKKTGTATITATSGTGAKATASVNVSGASSSITFVPSSITCNKGKVIDLLVNYSGTFDSFAVTENFIASAKKSSIQPGGSKMSLDVTCSEKGSTTLVFKTKDKGSKAITITVK